MRRKIRGRERDNNGRVNRKGGREENDKIERKYRFHLLGAL